MIRNECKEICYMVDDEMVERMAQKCGASCRGMVVVRGTVRSMVDQGLDKAARTWTELPCLLVLHITR